MVRVAPPAKRSVGRPKEFDRAINIKLTNEQITSMERLAEQRGITRADAIREAIEAATEEGE